MYVHGINFIRKWRAVQFNVSSERQFDSFLRNSIMANLFTLKVLEDAVENLSSYFVLMPDLAYEPGLYVY